MTPSAGPATVIAAGLEYPFFQQRACYQTYALEPSSRAVSLSREPLMQPKAGRPTRREARARRDRFYALISQGVAGRDAAREAGVSLERAVDLAAELAVAGLQPIATRAA